MERQSVEVHELLQMSLDDVRTSGLDVAMPFGAYVRLMRVVEAAVLSIEQLTRSEREQAEKQAAVAARNAAHAQNVVRSQQDKQALSKLAKSSAAAEDTKLARLLRQLVEEAAKQACADAGAAQATVRVEQDAKSASLTVTCDRLPDEKRHEVKDGLTNALASRGLMGAVTLYMHAETSSVPGATDRKKTPNKSKGAAVKAVKFQVWLARLGSRAWSKTGLGRIWARPCRPWCSRASRPCWRLCFATLSTSCEARARCR